jgi:hypothetical protein
VVRSVVSDVCRALSGRQWVEQTHVRWRIGRTAAGSRAGAAVLLRCCCASSKESEGRIGKELLGVIVGGPCQYRREGIVEPRPGSGILRDVDRVVLFNLTSFCLALLYLLAASYSDSIVSSGAVGVLTAVVHGGRQAETETCRMRLMAWFVSRLHMFAMRRPSGLFERGPAQTANPQAKLSLALASVTSR